MILAVDANAIVRRPLLAGAKWDAIGAAVAAGLVELVVPSTAVQEAAAVFDRQQKQRIRELRRFARKSSRLVQEALDAAINLIEQEVRSYPDALDGRLEELGAKVPNPPSIDHTEVVERATSRRAPFDANGNGYRDTLFWMSALESAEATGRFDLLVVVSADRVFHQSFADLAEEAGEIGVRLSLVRTLEEVAIPGEYAEEDLDLSDVRLRVSDVKNAIKTFAVGFEFSPAPDDDVSADFITVESVDEVDIDQIGVRKRYATDLYEIEVTADLIVKMGMFAAQEDESGVEDVIRGEAIWRLRSRCVLYADESGLDNDLELWVSDAHEVA